MAKNNQKQENDITGVIDDFYESPEWRVIRRRMLARFAGREIGPEEPIDDLAYIRELTRKRRAREQSVLQNEFRRYHGIDLAEDPVYLRMIENRRKKGYHQS